MAFTKWETFLEDHIEGFFNKKFGSALEPIEVEKKLEKEIASAKKRTKKGAKEWLLPNEYTISMNEDDCHHLSSQRFLDELYVLAEKKVIVLDAFMDGKLAIRIQKDAELSLGLCRIKSAFSDMVQRVAQAVEEQHTIVLQRPSFQAPLNLPTEYEIASLRVVQGADIDSYLAIGEKKIFLGRRERSDFILTDPNASRVHASIRYERHRHFLQDEQSTNGTLLNGRPVLEAWLRHGDEIQIGNSILRYEVI